ncbi:MAG: chromosome partitioning protein ParB [Gammaproteobacteria bacterium]|nr:MAG: chromosome partitioning protein ParB [Gammaproteobacteria bacterium]
MVRKAGLKRGLDALLATKKKVNQQQAKDPSQKEGSVPMDGDLKNIPVEFLKPGKYQPRRDMGDEGLQELADSIRAQGIIQPVVVRPLAKDSYEIIAGERRWRAAQKAGLADLPAIIKDVPDEAAIAMSLIENIQRENLNAIDEAMALQRLMEEFELTHQEVADAVGKSRTTVTNLLRLLGLNEETRILLERGDIDMGHARALLALASEQQTQAARQVAEKGMSVRDTETLVRKLLNPVPVKEKPTKSHDVQRLEMKLSEQMGSPVQIQYNKKGKGKLVIQYASLDELDGILGKMGSGQHQE